MDRFFKMFSKGHSSGKKDEPKAKEEEDPMFVENNLNFEVVQMKPNDALNNLVKEIKIGGKHMESYDNYNASLDKLLSQFNEEATELDYRYRKVLEKNEMMRESGNEK